MDCNRLSVPERQLFDIYFPPLFIVGSVPAKELVNKTFIESGVVDKAKKKTN